MYSKKFKLYKDKVVAAFIEKSEQANASWLVDLNRRKIREYCVERIEMGIEPNDHRAISDYLKMKAGDKDYLTAIGGRDADYFQALYQFLREPTRNPASPIVELVSWLVEFQNRPFAKFLETEHHQPIAIEEQIDKVKGNEEQSDPTDIEEEEPVISTGSAISRENGNLHPLVSGTAGTGRPKTSPIKLASKGWYIGIAALAIIGIIYWLYPKNSGCMYWDNYHYVATSCNVPRPDTPLIALDEARLRSFTRIKNIDTITENSVGKLWWVRVNGQIEIYKEGGKHPLYPDKELKKVTDYVVNLINNRHSSN
jgi:hypothetical protein